MAGSRRAGYGAPGGLEGPLQQAGERASGGRHGRCAVLLKIPALPEMTATQPQPLSHLTPHPQLNTRREAKPSLSLSGRVRSRGGDAGRGTSCSRAGHSKGQA